MTLKQARECIYNFYEFSVYAIRERGRHLYDDGVFNRFLDKADAIVTACILTNDSDRVWRKAQEYKFELEDKLRDEWDNICR